MMLHTKVLTILSSVILISAVQLPFKAQSMNPFAPSDALPTLSDILTVERTASIFHDYIRSTSHLSPLLSSPQSNPTLFVPINSFITSLARKPHQGAPPTAGEIEIGVNDNREEDDAKDLYLELWVQRHIVLVGTNWNGEGEEGGNWESMAEGKFINVEKAGEDWIVTPGDIKVVKVVEGSNGRVVLIGGVLSLDD